MGFLKKENKKAEFVFECKFRCLNCYYIWSVEFEKGYIIDKRKGDLVVINPKKKIETFLCPNCDVEHFEVLDRRPIKKVEGG
jgi:hypothetical protein